MTSCQICRGIMAGDGPCVACVGCGHVMGCSVGDQHHVSVPGKDAGFAYRDADLKLTLVNVDTWRAPSAGVIVAARGQVTRNGRPVAVGDTVDAGDVLGVRP